jgi:cilla- and flagella-associated protein
LRDFSYCHKIQEIYLRKNLISDLQEVQHLTSLPKLRLLMLSHNPCASHPYYRPYVVHKLPALSRLDNADVKIEERAAANRLNFDQIFKENPSNVGKDSTTASSKQKRPSTPTVFQPNNVSNQ